MVAGNVTKSDFTELENEEKSDQNIFQYISSSSFNRNKLTCNDFHLYHVVLELVQLCSHFLVRQFLEVLIELCPKKIFEFLRKFWNKKQRKNLRLIEKKNV